MLKLWFVAGALALSASAASAAEERMLTYTKGIDPNAARAALPAGHASASVRLDCLAGADRFESCTVLDGAEAGTTLAEAAIKLSLTQRLEPKDKNGVAIRGRRFVDYVEMLAPGDRNPDWLRKPSAEQVAGVFPVQAIKDRKDGSATIRCRVTVEGFLDRCQVLSETPKDYNFGSAALLLSKQFAMRPKIRNGRPVEGEVTIPIHWGGLVNGGGESVSAKRLMTDPLWTSAPRRDDVAAAYPKSAAGVPSGQATLRCGVTKAGQATSCAVISEIPPNRGFGSAARTLGPKFAMAFNPEDADKLRQLELEIPFRFRNPTAPDNGRLTEPRWVQTLSQQGADMLYPKAAREAKVWSGLGSVDCAAAADGSLVDCKLVREEPAALGFGQAALEAAKLMKMNLWTKGGDPVEGRRLTLPIRFAAEAPTADAPAAPKP